MTSVGCWVDECKWCKSGWCHRGAITISEDLECEDFENYRDSYTDAYWKALHKDGKKFRRLEKYGKKIEYNGYVFYTDNKITEDGEYYLTEERTGYGVGTFKQLKEQRRWDAFVEGYETYPDVLTLPVEESEG